MNENEIKQKLDRLAVYHAQLDAAMLKKQALLDKGVTANIAALEAEIKQAVIAHGASVIGTFFHAVLAKGEQSVSLREIEVFCSL